MLRSIGKGIVGSAGFAFGRGRYMASRSRGPVAGLTKNVMGTYAQNVGRRAGSRVGSRASNVGFRALGGAGRIGRGASRALGARSVVLPAGVALGVGGALTDDDGVYRQQVYPAMGEVVGGDPGYFGIVARAKWNNQWMTPGTPRDTPRAGGFGPSGRIVFGMDNTKHG